jgi:hypothetical protein
MGFVGNIMMSIPLGTILYILTEKIITFTTTSNNYNDRLQNIFIMGFIIGALYIIVAMTLFNAQSNIYNQTLQLSILGCGILLLLNSVLLNWSDLNEGTKIVMLTVFATSIIIYSYRN